MTVAQLAQDFRAGQVPPLDTREVAFQQQVKNQFGIPPVVLLPPSGEAPDFTGVADPDLAAEFLKQLLEPAAVATGLQADDDSAGKLRVELAQIIGAVVELNNLNFARVRVTVSDSLRPRMEIDAAKNCPGHRHLRNSLMSAMSLSRLEVPASYLHITGPPNGIAGNHANSARRLRCMSLLGA